MGYQSYTDNLTVLQAEDDAATANWGSGWRMPTKSDWEELLANTTISSVNQNGVNGRLFTATNGNTLFLPGGGYRFGDNTSYQEYAYCYYWSSTLYNDDPRLAYDSRFGSSNNGISSEWRCFGMLVRPVRAAN